MDGWLVGWPGWLAGWLAGGLAVHMAGGMAGWKARWLTGWLARFYTFFLFGVSCWGHLSGAREVDSKGCCYHGRNMHIDELCSNTTQFRRKQMRHSSSTIVLAATHADDHIC